METTLQDLPNSSGNGLKHKRDIREENKKALVSKGYLIPPRGTDTTRKSQSKIEGVGQGVGTTAFCPVIAELIQIVDSLPAEHRQAILAIVRASVANPIRTGQPIKAKATAKTREATP